MRRDDVLDGARSDGDADATTALMRRILSDMLDETMDLMETTEALAARSSRTRSASAVRDPVSAAMALRLSTRLAAIGGWVVGRGAAPVDRAESESEDAAAVRTRLREALRRSTFAPLDPDRYGGELSAVVARTEALLARAIRLDAQFADHAHDGAAADERRG